VMNMVSRGVDFLLGRKPEPSEYQEFLKASENASSEADDEAGLDAAFAAVEAEEAAKEAAETEEYEAAFAAYDAEEAAKEAAETAEFDAAFAAEGIDFSVPVTPHEEVVPEPEVEVALPPEPVAAVEAKKPTSFRDSLNKLRGKDPLVKERDIKLGHAIMEHVAMDMTTDARAKMEKDPRPLIESLHELLKDVIGCDEGAQEAMNKNMPEDPTKNQSGYYDALIAGAGVLSEKKVVAADKAAAAELREQNKDLRASIQANPAAKKAADAAHKTTGPDDKRTLTERVQAAYDAGGEVLASAAFIAQPENQAVIKEIRKSKPATEAAVKAWQDTRKAKGSLVECDMAANKAGESHLESHLKSEQKAERTRDIGDAYDKGSQAAIVTSPMKDPKPSETKNKESDNPSWYKP